MEPSEKIVYHATHASLHLQELIDMKLPGLSTMSEALLKDTAELLEGLAKKHS